jgi:hypothetical protein
MICSLVVGSLMILQTSCSPIKVVVQKPVQTISGAKNDIQEYAKTQVLAKWGEDQWDSFNKIVTQESGWNSNAQNKHSTAYGLCQFLDSTWKHGKTSDPKEQLSECISYIADRYQTPTQAWNFHLESGWY